MKQQKFGFKTMFATALASVLAIVLFFASPPLKAFFGIDNSATETTQMLNNIELMASVNKQSVMVSQQFKDYVVQLNQWSATLQNIANLPMSVYSTVMGPYNTVVGAATNFASSVHNLQTTASNIENGYRAKLQAAGKQGISGGEYMKIEAQLAREKGGIYKKQVEDDIRAIDDFKFRAQAVKEAAARIPSLKGNVESLGLLNQQLNQAVSSLEEMRAMMLRDSKSNAQAKSKGSEARAAAADEEAQRRQKSEEVRKSNPVVKDIDGFWNK